MKNEHECCAEIRKLLQELFTSVERYESKLRAIRDLRGDDKCWQDFEKLFALLPEGYTPPKRDTTVELAHCERFIASIHNPGTVYISPEREIEELKKLINKLRVNSDLTAEERQLYDQVWVDGHRGDIRE